MESTKSIALLFERLGRIVQNDAHSQGLKPTQWEALRYIARANRFSRNPGALTRYLGMTKGTVSQTLSALEKKGLIIKGAHETDKRAVQLSVSEKGAQLLAADPLQALERACRNQMQGDVALILENILRDMIVSRGGQSFGACKTCVHFQTDAPNGNPFYCGLLSEPLTARDSEEICVEQKYA